MSSWKDILTQYLDEGYPKWTNMDGKLGEIIEMNKNLLYQHISNMFHETLDDQFYKILRIDIIKNIPLMKNYQDQRNYLKKIMKMTNINEQYLWHGSTKPNIKNIAINGFKYQCNKKHVYGKGTYFGKTAKKSLHYATPNEFGLHVMVLSRVILGQYCKGKTRYLYPPRNIKRIQYNSMVDNVVNPSIFVVSNDYQCYPEFIIQFSEIGLKKQ